MLCREDLMLSDEQLEKYNKWVSRLAQVHGKDESSFSVELRISFSPLGREITAVIPGSKIILQLE